MNITTYEESDQRTVNVLHVDDEPGFAEMVADFIEKEDEDISVETVTRAEDALERLEGHNDSDENDGGGDDGNENDEDGDIDCIVSDYEMPGMDGLELLERVRDDYPDMPFILFTGRGSEEVASEAISAGVTDYLQKESGTEQYKVLANRIRNSVSMRRSKRGLRETSKHLRAVLDTVSASVFMKDTEGRYIMMNQNCRDMLGLDYGEAIGATDYDIFDDETAEKFREDDRHVFEEGETIQKEEKVPTPDGKRAHLTLKSPVFDDDGEPYAVCAVSTDITERKERERELREQQSLLETVLSNVPVVMFALDDEGIFTRSRGKALNEIGLEPDEAVGESVFELYEDKSDVLEQVERALGGESVQATVENNGRLFETWYEPVENGKEIRDRGDGHNSGNGSVTEVVGLSYDITEREEREEELERYEAFIENASDVITHIDENGTVLYQSPSVERVFGYEQDETVGDSVFDYIHPEDREEMTEEFYSVLNDPETEVEDVELRMKKADGTYVWVEATGSDHTDTKAGGFVVNSRDISERKKREKELERYEALVENTTDLVTLIDEDGTILYQSPSAERILGYDPEKAVDNNVFEFVHIEDRGDLMDRFSSLLEEPEIRIEDVEYRFRRVDGDTVWLEASVADRRDTELDGFVVIARDVTERKKRNEELRKTKERLGLAIEGAKLGVWDWDIEADEVEYNDRWAEILGMSPEDADYDIEFREENAHPDDLPEVNRKLEEHLADVTERFEAEYRMRTADDDWRWIRTVGQVVERDDDGAAKRVVGIHMDVDDRKRREEETRRLKERLDLAVEGAKLGVWDRDIEAGEVTYNDEWLEILELSPEEAEADISFWGERVHPDDRTEVERSVENHIKGETDRIDAEYRMRTGDGDWRWIHSIGHVAERGDDGRAKRTVTVHIDVDERKRTERELEEERDMFADGPAVVFKWGAGEGWLVEYVSENVENILGYTKQEMEGHVVFADLIHDDDIADVEEQEAKVAGGERENIRVEPYRVTTKDGETRWVMETTKGVRENGEIDHYLGYLVDVTERKEREKELERYEAFIQNSSDSITHVDEDGTILYRNPSTERVEDEPVEMEGTSAFEHVHPEDREKVQDAFEEVLREDTDTVRVEYRSKRDDGTYEWVEAVATDQTDTEVGGVIVNTRVVEERKEREKELERYEAFVENSSDIIMHVAEDSTILYQSPRAEELLGLDPDERVGENSFERIHPGDRDDVAETLMSLLGSPDKKMDEAEFRLEKEDGSYVWIEAAGADQTNTDIGGVVLSLRDISERKKRERELEKYEAFIENSSDIVTHLDEDGTILYQSPSAVRILGHEYGERVGDNAFDYVHPDDMETAVEEFTELLDSSQDTVSGVEMRYERDDGEYVWLEMAGSDQRETEVGGVIVNSREISERKKYERELERSQNLLRKTERIANTGGWEVDFETGKQRWTEGTYRIHGVSEEYEPTLEMGIEFYHPEDRDTIRRAVERCREEGEPYTEELRLITADGDIRWVRTSGEPVYKRGEIVKLRGSIRDITVQKEHEVGLLRNNMAIRGMYQVTSDPDLSFEDKIEIVLEACRSRLELPYAFVTEIDTEEGTQTVKQARGTHELLQPDESYPLDGSYCRKTVEGDGLLSLQNATEEGWEGDEAYEAFGLECYIGAKLTVEGETHGTVCFADTQAREEPFSDFERTLVELVSNWISYELERRRSKERLRRQKERLDDFASVVSHDLRSPLTVLMGNLELAEETGDSDFFERCRDAVKRMEAIIDDLLSLAREVDETGEIDAVAVDEVIEESWENTDTKNAELRVETDNTVMADRGKLRQMFENLLRNSVEHGGDDVTVTVTDVSDGDGFRVEDDGPGIPADDRRRVFKPGYTTSDEGTGLGMYIVKQVAEVHGWEIDVDEHDEGGAAFEVTSVDTVRDDG